MSEAEKKPRELEKKAFSLKVLYFNRYLIIRYLTAGFFFTNLYWLVSLLLASSKLFWVPSGLLFFLLPVVAEQVALYRTHKNNATVTRNYFWLQALTNVFLLLAVFSPGYSQLFPFMANGSNGQALILCVIACGLLICLFCQRRLNKIHTDTDRHYQRIKEYERVVQFGKGSK
ncbi:hypothetical protein QJ527_12600 [Enterococcus mundtii]|uniref:hypothetical protein n=1 Tax=Enterococcus TaxID=1350 RepID=UPI00044B5C00|nr:MULTISPECIES: hypothetical protein [Enterococcus]MCW6015579.1 hypothetical protein [Serratia marcescens]AZP93788.1 hypothetical protein CYK55_12245 [Enterococcus mundtii]EYT94995.1 hypothetical protein AK89_10670 [Enterococcus mundtii CRL35]MDA9427665.1 hypothetical protein [Enterococcus mundtii 1A]MDK4212371.1 hypothetical protein [Enterococcus mundtii]